MIKHNVWKYILCLLYYNFYCLLHRVFRYDLGETNVPFCLQSVVKPLNYALTLNDLSPEVVHQYVGQEPSGRSFNELTLDYQRTCTRSFAYDWTLSVKKDL